MKKISVLDRTKEPGSIAEPLALDVMAALKGSKFENVPVYHGRYGLGSKDTTPAQIIAVYDNTEKETFTIGITDDVTNLSLPTGKEIVTTPEGTYCCKFWGLGADGTVGANKNSIKIIGDNTDMYAQAYFDYDSKKSGGVTMSHLRFGKKPIKSTYLIHQANFVACHKASYIRHFNMVQELVDGGTFLLNCPWSVEQLDSELPGQVKKFIHDHHIKFYIIDGVKLGIETGMGPTRINTILQSAFFKLTGIIPVDTAIDLMKKAAAKTYGSKGQDVVDKNCAAIDAGATHVVEVKVPDSWGDCADEGLEVGRAESGRADAVAPSGTAAYEKRGIAVAVPVWDPTKCVGCNTCSFVCPHAAIRPVAMTADEAAKAPEGMPMKDQKQYAPYKFAIVTAAMDCTGCGSCANVCPAKALTLGDLEANQGLQKYFDYAVTLPEKDDLVAKFKETSVIGSQFKQPLLEFSGACAGCGETPYAKLITQLFGDRMYIANATGCSSIWGNSSPSTPYTVNAKGHGPAWNNSLFEDNAEFGFGMYLAQDAIRAQLTDAAKVLADKGNEAAQKWIDTKDDGAANGAASDALLASIASDDSEEAKYLKKNADFLAKKSQWIFGGDGWAFDIGFGGLDHVLASGKDVNVFVFNTEVYSNTGGQSSKATPEGAVAQFAAGGKETKQKDLASIAMSYGYVYVAQISLGADKNQALKAIAEAEAYHGPSLIIGYAPCINHHIKVKGGMSKVMDEEKAAVDTGYWNLFRFNPAGGDKKFYLDSKPATLPYSDFLKREARYTSLQLKNPEKAERLFTEAAENAQKHYEYLQKCEEMYNKQ